MKTYTTVSIIIQARSTSSRLPGKIFELIGHKQILEHVLDTCYNCSKYINAYTNSHGIVCGVALAVPENDILIPKYSRNIIIQGPENDVLSRYMKAAAELKSDFVVRITADCPFIPPFIISRAINLAVKEGLDYITNADPRYRTAPDGHDVQVMSMRMLNWLNENAKNDYDREHVASLLVTSAPVGFSIANLIGFADYSALKYSIDTKEDLEVCRKMYNKIFEAVNNSPKTFRV